MKVNNSDLIINGSICNLKLNPCNNFYFYNDKQIELLRISKLENGWNIIFNKQEFPQYSKDDFVREFIDCLEKTLIR